MHRAPRPSFPGTGCCSKENPTIRPIVPPPASPVSSPTGSLAPSSPAAFSVSNPTAPPPAHSPRPWPPHVPPLKSSCYLPSYPSSFSAEKETCLPGQRGSVLGYIPSQTHTPDPASDKGGTVSGFPPHPQRRHGAWPGADTQPPPWQEGHSNSQGCDSLVNETIPGLPPPSSTHGSPWARPRPGWESGSSWREAAGSEVPAQLPGEPE